MTVINQALIIVGQETIDNRVGLIITLVFIQLFARDGINFTIMIPLNRKYEAVHNNPHGTQYSSQDEIDL